MGRGVAAICNTASHTGSAARATASRNPTEIRAGASTPNAPNSRAVVAKDIGAPAAVLGRHRQQRYLHQARFRGDDRCSNTCGNRCSKRCYLGGTGSSATCGDQADRTQHQQQVLSMAWDSCSSRFPGGGVSAGAGMCGAGRTCLAVDFAPVRRVVSQRLLADGAGGAHCIRVGLQLLQGGDERVVSVLLEQRAQQRTPGGSSASWHVCRPREWPAARSHCWPLARRVYWEWCAPPARRAPRPHPGLTRTHCVWMVCPHLSTVVGSTDSNRNSKQMGQFWCIARSTHWWLPCGSVTGVRVEQRVSEQPGAARKGAVSGQWGSLGALRRHGAAGRTAHAQHTAAPLAAAMEQPAATPPSHMLACSAIE